MRLGSKMEAYVRTFWPHEKFKGGRAKYLSSFYRARSIDYDSNCDTLLTVVRSAV